VPSVWLKFVCLCNETKRISVIMNDDDRAYVQVESEMDAAENTVDVEGERDVGHVVPTLAALAILYGAVDVEDEPSAVAVAVVKLLVPVLV